MNQINKMKKQELSITHPRVVTFVKKVLFIMFVFELHAYAYSFMHSFNHKKGSTMCTTARLNSKYCNSLKRIVF